MFSTIANAAVIRPMDLRSRVAAFLAQARQAPRPATRRPVLDV